MLHLIIFYHCLGEEMKPLRLCLLTVTLFTLMACSKKEEQIKETLVRPVKLFNIGHDSQVNIRSFPAEVVANQGSYLAFRVNGELVEFPVLAGVHVEKGQLLAKLDPEDFQLQYDERKARFELAKSQLMRITTLFEKKIASQSELDQALANKQIAESAFKISATNLEYTELRAPFSGIVAKVFVKNFENIQAKQNILRLETRDLMDVEIQVPEKIVARFQKGTNYQPTVKFDGYDNKEYTLTIKEWDTQADPATLTYKVVFSLPVPKDFNLLAGMTGRVLIDLSKVTHSQVAYTILPTESVFSEPKEAIKDNAYVWLFNPDTGIVNKKVVKVGQLHRDGIEVLSGVEEGQIVVSAGVHSLKEGMQVRPWNKERGL